jgi:hypothetical protein
LADIVKQYEQASGTTISSATLATLLENAMKTAKALMKPRSPEKSRVAAPTPTPPQHFPALASHGSPQRPANGNSPISTARVSAH